MEFVPARNKLEAVARISSLTNSGPETLGPGSKERKSVLTNLAKGLNLEVDESDSKHELAAKIAQKLGKVWTPDCESIGQTITLKGLNLLLEATTLRLSRTIKNQQSKSIFEETMQISEIVYRHTPRKMDGVTAIREMKEAEFSKWALTEWQGQFFEFKVRPHLINALGGGPVKVGRTEFDYELSYVWDMKVHSSQRQNGKRSTSGCQLNDGYSMEKAVKETGLGLIVLSGIPLYDWEFTKWFKDFRSTSKNPPRRPLKKEFKPERIDYYFIPNSERFKEALAKKQLQIFKQGRQQSGHSRNYKYSLDLQKAGKSDLLVHSTPIV
jgi:hypothetical protein